MHDAQKRNLHSSRAGGCFCLPIPCACPGSFPALFGDSMRRCLRDQRTTSTSVDKRVREKIGIRTMRDLPDSSRSPCARIFLHRSVCIVQSLREDVAYIHCTAGLGRAPATALGYMPLGHGMMCSLTGCGALHGLGFDPGHGQFLTGRQIPAA